jgi:hypothetical protein
MSKRDQVDPAPVRAHVEQLIALGMTINMIARAAGTSDTPIAYLLAGRQNTMLADSANAILAVTPRPHRQQALVLNYGLRRRLEGLAVMGWSVRAVGDEAGIPFHTVSRARLGVRTQLRIHDIIADVYDRISHLDGGSPRTRKWAQSNGFVHPMLWDDIDDPDEVPAAPKDSGIPDEVIVERILAGTWTGDIPNVERRAAYERLEADGASAKEIADLLHVTQRTIERYRSSVA